MSESLFLVSSAIDTRHGIYHRSSRFKQTKNTIASIQKHCPDSDMVVLDGGQRDIHDFEKKDFSILEFRSFAGEQTVKDIHKVNNHDIVKNMIEIYMYREFLKHMLDNEWEKKYKRIFKVSGRYTLTDTFSYDKHIGAVDKICVLNSRQSQFPPEITGNVKLQYMSRLWSFDSSLLSYIHNAYCKMFDDMQNRIQSRGYIDIEHLLYKHLDPDRVVNLDKVGIEGNIAPNGLYVIE